MSFKQWPSFHRMHPSTFHSLFFRVSAFHSHYIFPTDTHHTLDSHAMLPKIVELTIFLAIPTSWISFPLFLIPYMASCDLWILCFCSIPSFKRSNTSSAFSSSFFSVPKFCCLSILVSWRNCGANSVTWHSSVVILLKNKTRTDFVFCNFWMKVLCFHSKPYSNSFFVIVTDLVAKWLQWRV